jgi:hypothetical protein
MFSRPCPQSAEGMPRTYFYVVDRDFGFAPNPFHSRCTLATCKAKIRARAQFGDWVVGMGGTRLDATGRCVFAMRVSQTLSFNEYWSNPDYFDKRPVRNGTRKMMVGDNIYNLNSANGWQQADSHHNNSDGTINTYNLTKDTRADRVLISNNFFYFGAEAPQVPKRILHRMGYRNCRDYRVFEQSDCVDFLNWLYEKYGSHLNLVLGDPFDFEQSFKRYSAKDNKIR